MNARRRTTMAAERSGPRLCQIADAASDEPGKMAAWLAPPEGGINNLPAAYEYVRLN